MPHSCSRRRAHRAAVVQRANEAVLRAETSQEAALHGERGRRCAISNAVQARKHGAQNVRCSAVHLFNQRVVRRAESVGRQLSGDVIFALALACKEERG